MNGTKELLKDLIDGLNKVSTKTKVIVAPPFPYIPLARSLLKDEFVIGAQNVSSEKEGAHTGEVSAQMLLDVGVKWVIIGHSERRQLYGETNEIVSKKVKSALDLGLKTIVCVGETLTEREASRQCDVIIAQLDAIFKTLTVQCFGNLVIAYEPIWAIGTGKVATPEQAQHMHSSIMKWLSTTFTAEIAMEMHILYGGSVNASNCEQLKAQPDVDGFLVGGASLKPEFSKICSL